jgi:hypothetical protein
VPKCIYLKDEKYCLVINAKPNAKTSQITGKYLVFYGMYVCKIEIVEEKR